MLTQRDQFTNEQIPITDQDLIISQHQQRLKNHKASEISKAPSGKYHKTPNISVGELVYLYTDRNKHRARDRYIVVSVEGEWCNVRKFIGAQLRRMSYRVKLSQCYKVNADIPIK